MNLNLYTPSVKLPTKSRNLKGNVTFSYKQVGYLILFLFVQLIAIPANSQINYSQDFAGCSSNPCGGWTWSVAGSMTATTGMGYTPCAVADPAARANLSSTITTGNLTSSASLGTSVGEITTFGFSFKCVDFNTGAATAANSCTLNVEWATSSMGPWTLIQSIQNPSSTACTPFVSNTFFPTAGQPIFMRVRAVRNTGDFWLVIDNITLNQPSPALVESTSCSCNNDQTPNMQNGTYSTTLKIRYTDNAPMPSGLSYKITATTGLTNPAGGVLGTPNFLYCNGVGCPSGITNGQYYLPVRVISPGNYTADVDGPDPDITSDINLNSSCSPLYPALPVISLNTVNCLNPGVITFSSDMAVYSINNSLVNPILYDGFSQTGTGNLTINNDNVNESENDPTMELYLIKEVLGCRVSSYKEFKVFKAVVPTLKDIAITCRTMKANDTLFLNVMLDSTNTGGGKFFIGGNEVVGGKLGLSGPICSMVTYSIIDSCGVTHSDTKALQVTYKPAPAFNFSPTSPVSPVCARTDVVVGIVKTSTGPNPSFSVTSNNPLYSGSISGSNATFQAPAIGQSVKYTVCLQEVNPAQAACGSLPAPAACSVTFCKSFTVYRDKSDCGANALFASTCADDQTDVCPAFPNPAINIGCSFFSINTPDILESSITFDNNIYNCDDTNITGSYDVSFIGLDAGAASGGPTIGSLPGLNVVCRVLNFKILGWRPLGSLYNLLGCGKSLVQAIFDFVATIAGGTGGGYIVMADTDGDGGFDEIIDNKGGDDSVFPGTGTFSIPNRVKGNGYITVRAVSGWVNKPSSVCGNFDIEPLNILDRFPIGAIPIVGAVVEAILNAANCGIDVALSQEVTESVKVLNNSSPEFLNCNTGGYTFAQTLDCTIPVNWSVPVAIDGCSDLPLTYRGPTSGADTTNYAGALPLTLVLLNSPGVYQTAGPVPGSILEPGVYPITYTAVSCNGLPTLCNFNVIVTSGNPILECPNDITLSTDQDVCVTILNGLAPYQGVGCSSIINYSFTSPVSNTVFSTSSTIKGTHNIPDGLAFELGTTTVTYTMEVDINGDGDYSDLNETQTCSFNVVVVDKQFPEAVCLDVELQLNNLGTGTVYARDMANQIYIDGGSTDNCSIDSILISKDNINFFPSLSFDCADKGQNVVIMKVVDGSGNVRSCKAVVKVIDFFEGFKLDLDVPEVCFEPFQNTYDFSPYLVIARPNGANLSHQNVSVLGPEVFGAFGISAFLPDPGSTNDPGTMTTDGVYTLGTGTGWITISYILSIDQQVNQIDDTSPLTGCFLMVHDVFRVQKLDPVWKGGFMCCDQTPVWLGGAAWNGTGAPPIPPGMLSLTDIRGDYPGDVYGEWIGQGVSFVNPDNILYSGDEFFQFNPSGLDGTYTLTYIVGDEPCEFTYSQDIRVTCQDLHVDISDYTVCPANWVEEKQVLVNLDDKDLVVSTTGFAALAADGAHYGGGPALDPVMDLDSVPVVDGRVVIPGFYAPAVRNKNYEICVTTFQTTPFGCADVFCYTITVQDLLAPDFQNCPKEAIVVDAPFGWCNSFVNFEYPWAADNCMGLYSKIEQVDTTGLKSGDLFPVGLTILAYTAIDTVGNQNYCEIKIVVNDFHTPPNIDCPGNKDVVNDNNVCGAVVNNIAPVKAEDNCIDNATIQYEITDASGNAIACGFEDASGELFPVGTSSVKYTIMDQPLILITEVVQDGVVAGMEITNFGPAEVDISCAKFVMKNAAGTVLETFTLASNNNISTKFDRPIFPPVNPILWNVRNPDNILKVGETFTHIFNGDQDGDGDIDVINRVLRCDVRRYCFSFLERVIDEAWINDQVDGAVILRKNECDHGLQSDFIPATPCDPGSFGMLNPGLTTMQPNGTSTALQNYPPNTDMCTFSVKVTDTEAPTCIWHDTIPLITAMIPLQTPLNIPANTCLKATVTMPAGIVDDVNIRNLKITIPNAGAVTAYLKSPLGTKIKLFDRVCSTDSDVCDGDGLSGFPNVNVNLDETIKWTPAPSIVGALCTPSLGAGGIYRPEESFKEFYGEQGGGIWTLEVFAEEGATGILTDWDLQILYRKPFNQPDVVLENAPGRCDQEFSWIHPILEDNCCVGKVDVKYSFHNNVTGESAVENGIIKNESGTINVQGCRVTRIFKVGTTVVEYTLEDQYGNLNTCSFKVTVNDVETPKYVSPYCPDRIIRLAPGACYGLLDNPPAATDNCAMKGVSFCFEDGTPADISNLPIGVYNLVGKAEDIYGNVERCTFKVTVLEFLPTDNSLACNDHLNISLDANCEAVVTADMILEGGPYRCYENYCIEIRSASGQIHPNLFTVADEGKTFTVSVIDCNGTQPFNSCWGTIKIEEKLIPELVCPPNLTVACNVDVEARNPSTGKLLTGEAILESCEVGANINWQDEWISYGQCNNPRALVKRLWTIIDSEGHKVECTQEITIRPLNLDDVVFPADLDFDHAIKCEDADLNPLLTSPAHTGYPTINGVQVNKAGSLCMVSLNYTDEIYDICSGSYEILRYWKVRNMCLPVSGTNPRTHVQVIKVLDSEGPIIKDCPSDITLSVNPWNCRAGGELHVPLRIEELCSSDYSFKANIYGGGKIKAEKTIDGTIKATVSDLFVGDYRVVYTLKDECGNKSVCSFNIHVVDKAAPIPVLLQDIVVSLVPGNDAGGQTDGQAKLFVTSVDNGSFDNCSGIRMEIRRTDDRACGNIGNNNHNNNGTYSNAPANTINNNVNDTDFGAFVKFCCADIPQDSAYGIVTVEVRVWDDGNLNGVIGDAGDNWNLSWANVRVDCKIPPVITCPADATIYCDWAIPTNVANGAPGTDNAAAKPVTDTAYDFAKTGLPSAYGVCVKPQVTFWDREFFNQCDLGYILRTFIVKDKGYTATCVQRIDVLQSLAQNPWTFIPSSLSLTPVPLTGPTACEGPTEAQIKANGPKYTAGPCDVIGVSTKQWQFDFEDGVCRKWKIEYKYVNWCTLEERGPYYKYFIYEDTKAPEFTTCRDTMYAVDGNCEAVVKLHKTAIDTSGCISTGWLKWEVYIDLWADGDNDYLFSSFYSGADGAERTIGGDVVKQYKLGPGSQYTNLGSANATSSGGKLEITIPEKIVGKMSNHKVSWKVTDGCHNFTTCHEIFMVADKKAPTPVCVPLSTALMQDPDGNGPLLPMVALWAIDFMTKAYDNCTSEEDLLYTFDDWAPQIELKLDANGNPMSIDHPHFFGANGGVASAVNPNTSAYNAARAQYLAGNLQLWIPENRSSAKVWVSATYVPDTYKEVDVHVTVWDKKFNHDYCWTVLKLGYGGNANGSKIAGNVKTLNEQTVNNVSIEIHSNQAEYPKSMTTNTGGTFEFANLTNGFAYEIAANKDGDYLNGVTTLDLVMIQRHILGIQKIDHPYKVIAGDANNDGKVSASDLTELRKLILGITTSFKNASWRFPLPGQILDSIRPFPFAENISLPNLISDKDNQNFIAVKIGDINGSATADLTAPVAENRNNHSLHLMVPEMNMSAGEIVTIPVLADNFENISGYQFTLRLKDAEILNVLPGELQIMDSNYFINGKSTMTMSYSADQAVSLASDAVLFYLVVKVNDKATTRDIMNINSDITRAECYSEHLTVGKISLGIRTSELAGIELMQNEPNPFRGQTTVRYFMPSAAKANIKVFDVNGKLIALRHVNAVKGMNNEIFTSDQLGASGVLYYTLQSGDFTATKKMIIVE